MKFDSVLIVTYGRSGSTLLQGILNSIEGCLIRGENKNFCFALYQAYQSIKYSKKFEAATEVTHAWYGAPFINEKIFLKQARQMTKELILSNQKYDSTIKCYGFKEIRYKKIEVKKNFQDYLEFLEKIFPNVCFIFLTRNLNDVLKSRWWANKEKKKTREQFLNLESKFAEFCDDRTNTFQITYENIISKSENLEAMFHFLGVKYTPEQIDNILSVRHSVNSRNNTNN